MNKNIKQVNDIEKVDLWTDGIKICRYQGNIHKHQLTHNNVRIKILSDDE